MARDDQSVASGPLLERIKTDIAMGRLAEGDRLPLAWLAKRYNVSTSVLREVLPRLIELGLVMNQPQSGFRVVSGSRRALQDLTDTRVVVETLAARLSVQEGSLGWESSLVGAHHALDRTPEYLPDGSVSDDWQVAHVTFHRALLCGCNNRRLVQLANSLREEAGIYTLSARALGSSQIDVRQEHSLLLQAAVERDAERVADLLETHIRAASQLYGDTEYSTGST